MQGIDKRAPESATPWAWFPVRSLNSVDREARSRIAKEKGRVFREELCSLTSAASNDPFPSFLISQVRHEVISSADLETEYFLEVFSFEPYLITEFCTQIRCKDKRGFFDDIIDFGT